MIYAHGLNVIWDRNLRRTLGAACTGTGKHIDYGSVALLVKL